jgi:hypothetical protein
MESRPECIQTTVKAMNKYSDDHCHAYQGGLTPRITPMPVKIVLAGENCCEHDVGE